MLDAFAVIDPLKIHYKIKLHLLTHAPVDAKRFGPLIGRMTEHFEKANAVFCACSIHSNRIAPSRDISLQFAGQESFRNCITGGLLVDEKQNLVQPSPRLFEFFQTHKIIRKGLGWVEQSAHRHGKEILQLD
jgi:hypothetical protein